MNNKYYFGISRDKENYMLLKEKINKKSFIDYNEPVFIYSDIASSKEYDASSFKEITPLKDTNKDVLNLLVDAYINKIDNKKNTQKEKRTVKTLRKIRNNK